MEAVIGNILDRMPKIGINEMFEQINTRGAEREGQVNSWHQRKNLTGEGQWVQKCQQYARVFSKKHGGNESAPRKMRPGKQCGVCVSRHSGAL